MNTSSSNKITVLLAYVEIFPLYANCSHKVENSNYKLAWEITSIKEINQNGEIHNQLSEK